MKLKPSAKTAIILVSLLLAACGRETPERYLASARASMAKNDDKVAIIQIKNALQADPNSGEARYLLGTALLDGGDFGGAELELRKAQALKFSPDLVVPKLATTLLAEGQFKKLTDEFSEAKLGTATSTADLQTSIAYALAMQGSAESSAAALKAALAAAPDFVPALIMQARVTAGKGDFKGALAQLDDIVQRDPQNVDAWQLRGDFYYATARPELALLDYRKALSLKSNFTRADITILSILLQQRNVDEAEKQLDQLRKVTGNTAQTAYYDALIDYLKGDFEKAREQAQQVLKVAPDNPSVLLLAGGIELQLGSFLQAEPYLEHAVQLAPKSAQARRLLVTAYLRSNQPDKAMAALHPGEGEISPDLYAVAGEVYLQNGAVKEAEDFFAKAAKLNPADASAKTSLALTHLVKGEAPLAFGELQGIAATDKGTSADMALISLYMRRGEFGKALTAIDSLERKHADQPVAAYLRGRAQLAMKNAAGARQSFERALVITPTYYPAIAGLAALDVADNKPEQAKKRFEDSLARNPKNIQALMALSELALRSGTGKDEAAALLGRAIVASPSESAPRLLLINMYLANRDLRQATSAAQNAVAALPDRPEVLDALGQVQLATSDFNQAIATYTKLIDTLPNSPTPYLRLADVNMAANHKDAAEANLRKGLELKPDLIEAQRKLVFLDTTAGNFQDAFAIARTVQQQRPTEALGFSLQGDISAARRDWDKAANAYQTGLKEAPSTDMAVKLHSVLLTSGKSSEADKFEMIWRKQHPDDAAFVFHLGDVAMVRKDYASAEKTYLEVLRLQPKNAATLNNLAWVTMRQNKEGALAYAERANELAPNQPAFIDTLATVLAEAKQYDKAIAQQKRALELEPSNADFKLSLAKLYLKAGNKADARIELNQLASLGSKFSAHAEVASMLGDL